MIVPTKVDYAVEFYIKPVDLPLIKEGQSVTCIFDGFLRLFSQVGLPAAMALLKEK